MKIIESKECNKNNKIKKEEAWQWVWDNYKAKFGDGKRSLKNLKDVWKRMKLTAKAEYHVVNKPKTGGGPPQPQPSAISAIIKQICSQEFIQMRNDFDNGSCIDGNEAVDLVLNHQAIPLFSQSSANVLHHLLQQP